MLITGVGLWAEDALARPQWVSGTWSVSDGLIRRVGDELADRADRCGFIVPGMVDDALPYWLFFVRPGVARGDDPAVGAHARQRRDARA